jgi:short-subunit dehydrogenase
MKNKINDPNLKALTFLLPVAYAGYLVYKELSRPAKRKNLKDQVIVITGASSGIGKAYAEAFAREGSKLVLAARSTDKLEKLAVELQEKYNTETIVVTTDVTKEDDARNLIEVALEHFDNIDILINNAGVSTYEFFYKENIENLKKVMDVNYWGMIYCTHAVLPSMIKRKKGKIVNISSFAGKRGMPAMANYSASKHAMQGFSEGLRVEVKKHGIDVLVICPTSTKTDIVSNSMDNSAFKLNPENYFGMSVERVANETIKAILDNKREHIVGLGEQFSFVIQRLAPGIVDTFLKNTIGLVMKE